jgi:uncharacterized protein YutE (UPF0331/DUF86 family)
MNFIKGLVISGSYKGSIVTILNEGFLLNGNIRITHFHDICKYNVSLFKKSKESTGKKVVGDNTYLFKDSIVLQPNCLCQKDDCNLSHLCDNVQTQNQNQIEKVQVQEKHESGGSIKKMTGDILKCLLVKYNNTPSYHNIINMCISHESHVGPYTTEMHENAFIHVAGLSIRSIIEQYCKNAIIDNKKPVREMVYLLRQSGYISVEKEIKLCDLLSLTNSIVHSTKKIDNTKDMLMKINNSLVSILYL